MTSLRKRLFLILLTATSVIWLCAVGWIYFGSRNQLEHVLDTRLQEAATMVHSLVASGNMTAAVAAVPIQGTSYERQLSCQIWSLDGQLVARSSGAPQGQLIGGRDGFADRVVDGETWRIYTIVDQDKGVRVAVGDRIGLRDRLIRDLIAGLMTPALLIVPLLGLLIWASLGRGLKPLRDIASEIVARDAEDMRRINETGTPSEIRPVVAAVNSLFGKVEAARRHEREVTAFAAHELRTPLAGLKTQAQVALATEDPSIRSGALNQILISVDRTARLVRQLLALAKLEAAAAPQDAGVVRAGDLLGEIVDASPISPANVHIEIDPSLSDLRLPGDREALHLILRNLHENAVAHMMHSGTVRWSPLPGKRGLMVEDDGPGIPEEELPLVTQRFYRGRHKTVGGTGLGLTIAAIAARRAGVKLTLANRADRRGLSASISWS